MALAPFLADFKEKFYKPSHQPQDALCGDRAALCRATRGANGWVSGDEAFQIGKNGLEHLYKAVAERPLDRISGEWLGYLSPYHDRIDLAHARTYALSPAGGEVPSRSLARETGEAAGLDPQDIRNLIQTIEAYERRSLVTDGQLIMQLESLGYSITADNLAKVRSTTTAAMARPRRRRPRPPTPRARVWRRRPFSASSRCCSVPPSHGSVVRSVLSITRRQVSPSICAITSNRGAGGRAIVSPADHFAQFS